MSKSSSSVSAQPRVGVVTATSIVVAALLVGCQGQPEPEVYDPEAWQGSIDESLPVEVQDKQNAMIRLFEAIQQVGVDHVSEEDPNIRFEENSEQFFEDDTVDLYRWDWDGAPKGDEFPVVLILRKDEPGFPEVEKRRTYLVRRSGKRYTISRAK